MINNSTCTSSTYIGNTVGNEILPGIFIYFLSHYCKYMFYSTYIINT